MAVSWSRKDHREGTHTFRWWMLGRRQLASGYEEHEGPGTDWWDGAGWGPWDSDAFVFILKSTAEGVMTGHVLAEDRFEYFLEMNEETHPNDDAVQPLKCKECQNTMLRSGGPQLLAHEQREQIAEDKIDGRPRGEYVEDEIEDEPSAD